MEAVQERAAWVPDKVAVRFAGAVGAVVSGTVIDAVLLEAETLFAVSYACTLKA